MINDLRPHSKFPHTRTWNLDQSLLILVNIVALPISKSKSITPFITLKKELILVPPGDPVIMKISPDKFVTITSAIVLDWFFPALNLMY